MAPVLHTAVETVYLRSIYYPGTEVVTLSRCAPLFDSEVHIILATISLDLDQSDLPARAPSILLQHLENADALKNLSHNNIEGLPLRASIPDFDRVLGPIYNFEQVSDFALSAPISRTPSYPVILHDTLVDDLVQSLDTSAAFLSPNPCHHIPKFESSDKVGQGQVCIAHGQSTRALIKRYDGNNAHLALRNLIRILARTLDRPQIRKTRSLNIVQRAAHILVRIARSLDI